MPRCHGSRSGPAARLRSVGVALRAAHLAAVGEASEALQPLPLDTEGGGVAAAKLEEILEAEKAALAVADYRRAAEMRDLHSVLSPASAADQSDLATSLSKIDSADVESQARFFYRFGFCVLPATFAGEHLERLQGAWRRNQRPFRDTWLAKASAESPLEQAEARRKRGLTSDGERPTYFDVPSAKLFEGLGSQLEGGAGVESPDAVLLDLVDPPPLVALMRHLLVPDQWSSLRMGGLFQPRTYPPRKRTANFALNGHSFQLQNTQSPPVSGEKVRAGASGYWL